MMKYNTVRQRRKVYARLLKEAQEGLKATYGVGRDFSICWGIARIVNTGYWGLDIKKQLPELWASGPQVKHVYWYPSDEVGLKQRIACIKRAIKKCDNEIQKQNDD